MKIPAPSARRLMPTRILKIVVLLFMSLVITELVFQFASRWVPAIDQVTASPWKVVPRWVKDESINGNRGNVEYWEHDDWGYRNETRLKNAKYVAMGDSFTYGTGVGRNEAWPPLLSEILKTPVYNMGVAARSPITYLTTFDRALSLNPRLVIVAVYLGNDFLESYWSRNFAKRHHPKIISNQISEELFRSAQEADNRESLWEKYWDSRDCGKGRNIPIEPQSLQKDDQRPHRTLRVWLSNNSKVYGLLRTLKNVLTGARPKSMPHPSISTQYERVLSKLEPDQLRYCYPFKSPDTDVQTIFSNLHWNLIVSNGEDPRIRIGIEIVKLSLAAMQEKSQQHGVRMMVLLLPSKADVYWTKVKASAIEDVRVTQEISTIHHNARRVSSELEDFLSLQDIEVLDLYDPLVASEVQVFFGGTDGHLNVAGNQVIARKLAQFLQNN